MAMASAPLLAYDARLPPDLGDDVQAFYLNITQELDRLAVLLSPDFITSEFMLHSLRFFSSLHSGIISLAHKLRLPASLHDGWLPEYLDETVKLMEVCNALKTGVERMDRYLTQVAGVMGARPARFLDACQNEFETLERENRNLVQAKFESEGNLRFNLSDDYVEGKLAKWNGFWGVMFAVKTVTSFLSWLLLWGLVHAGNSVSFSIETVRFESPWAVSFLRLQQVVNDSIIRVRRQVNSAPVLLLKEFKAIEIALTDLRGKRNIRRSQQELKRCSISLKELLEPLDWQISDILDSIVEGRKKFYKPLTS